MRNIKDVLRLKYVGKLSHERIAVALGVSKGVVTKYAGLASAAGLNWELVHPMDEVQLHNRLINNVAPQSAFVLPNYGLIHQELRRKGMTLMLLWEEHVQRHGPDQTHRYAQFCVRYREYAKSLKRSGGSPAPWPARSGAPTQCAQRRVHYGGRSPAGCAPRAYGIVS